MKFSQIVILDDINLVDTSVQHLAQFSQNPIKVYHSDPQTEEEIQSRIADADCILLSWRTAITKETLEKCSHIKFIGLAGTNSQCIDIEECSRKNIVISNVKDYGDEGVVEWIFLQLLLLLRGEGKYQWKTGSSELSGKTFGIIGLGTIGKMLAEAALGFKMRVVYHSRTRKPEWEEKGVEYLSKKDLLMQSDVITLQTPKNIKILDTDDFEIMKEKIFINNTLGKAFDQTDFETWIARSNNYAIMDRVSDFHGDFQNLERVIFSDFVSGFTREAKERLGRKISENLEAFLNGSPIHKVNEGFLTF
ncbi:dihydrofolate reductase [Candidatus Peregrinibacteria bacterium]|nr:MAG: dihydrofolate reductase [Candidatus Peregrinibacteria bacterium]